MRAVREAAALSYPISDIGELLAEIERGYIGSPIRPGRARS